MKSKKYLPYLVFILITLAAGGLSALFTMRGMPDYALLRKPPLTPPPMAFPVAWGILYLLMGIGAARVWITRSRARIAAVTIFAVQLILNFFWSVWFFGLQARLFAFVWLLVLLAVIAVMIWAFLRVDRPAGWMQVPYLLWTAFAAYLNLGVWLLNR